MSYNPTNWQNSPSTNTPINAANLNNMEQGIKHASDIADDLDPRVDLVEQRLDNLIPQGTPTEGNAELIDIRVGANGITYPDAGDAVRGQYTELKSALTVNVQNKVMPDLYEFSTLTPYNTIDDKRLKGNGQTEADSTRDVDRYYPLTPGEVIKITASNDWTYTYQFQDDLTPGFTHIVGSCVGGAVDAYVTVPLGAVCLCVCRLKTTTTNSVKRVGQSKLVDIDDSIEDLDETVFVEPDNLFQGSTRDDGYYGPDGTWTESETYRMALLPVGAVASGDTLYFPESFAYYGTSYRFDVLQENGTWIKYHNVSSYQPITIKVDSTYGSFYVAMRIKTSQDINDLVIVKNGILTKTPSVDLLRNVTNPLYGKTINCLGDSFTAPTNSWARFLADRVGATCNNYGQANSRVAIDTDTTTSFLNRYSSMDSSADIVVIFGGINDAASIKTHDLELGTIDSVLDNTTFYGALKLLIEDIKAYMPGKKIIGVIPPDFAPNDNYQNTLPLVQQACRDVYTLYSIPFADLKKTCQEMWEESSPSGYNNTNYRNAGSNDWHPSKLGHKAISEVIQGILDVYIKV